MLRVEYVAGFFDGEGSVGIYRNGRGTFHLRTQLTQNITPITEELMRQLVSQFGGNLARMQSPIYRCNAAFNWQNNGNNASSFLKLILPHLIIKREQASVAIAWQEQHLPPGRDKLGRMIAHEKMAPVDLAYERVMKILKIQSLSEIPKDNADLAWLPSALCVKG